MRADEVVDVLVVAEGGPEALNGVWGIGAVVELLLAGAVGCAVSKRDQAASRQLTLSSSTGSSHRWITFNVDRSHHDLRLERRIARNFSSQWWPLLPSRTHGGLNSCQSSPSLDTNSRPVWATAHVSGQPQTIAEPCRTRRPVGVAERYLRAYGKPDHARRRRNVRFG